MSNTMSDSREELRLCLQSLCGGVALISCPAQELKTKKPRKCMLVYKALRMGLSFSR
jgi:hypothetical protein